MGSSDIERPTREREWDGYVLRIVTSTMNRVGQEMQHLRRMGVLVSFEPLDKHHLWVVIQGSPAQRSLAAGYLLKIEPL